MQCLNGIIYLHIITKYKPKLIHLIFYFLWGHSLFVITKRNTPGPSRQFGTFFYIGSQHMTSPLVLVEINISFVFPSVDYRVTDSFKLSEDFIFEKNRWKKLILRNNNLVQQEQINKSYVYYFFRLYSEGVNNNKMAVNVSISAFTTRRL